MKKIAVHRVELADADPQLLLGRWIGFPKEGEEKEGDQLLLRGFALGRGSPVDRIEVENDGTKLSEFPLDVARPDLEPVFPDADGARASGFMKTVTVPMGPFALHLVAVFPDGTRVAIGSVSGTVSDAPEPKNARLLNRLGVRKK